MKRIVVLFLSLHLLSYRSMGQAFFSRMSKAHRQSSVKGTAAVASLPAKASAPLAVAAAPPTLVKFSPLFGGALTQVTLTGTNFEDGMTVSFGGTAASAVIVQSPNLAVALVAAGASGAVVVTTSHGPAATLAGFTFVAFPEIDQVEHVKQGSDTRITITGNNFVGACQVSVNGGVFQVAAVVSATTLIVYIPGNPVLTDVEVSTPGGIVGFSGAQPTQGSADLNLPDFSNGLIPIPTPSVDLNQVVQHSRIGFSERIWANALGLDSSRQRAGAKFLVPDVSLFGFKGEFDWRWTNDASSFALGMALECNLLVKKLSYVDTSTQTSSNFTPFVFHPRLGITSSFWSNNFYAGVYTNFMTVIGSNDAFASFFNTGAKNVFVYPELDFGGLIPLGNGSKQAVKFQFNLVVNNGDAQFLTTVAHDPIVPFLKIGYVTAL